MGSISCTYRKKYRKKNVNIERLQSIHERLPKSFRNSLTQEPNHLLLRWQIYVKILTDYRCLNGTFFWKWEEQRIQIFPFNQRGALPSGKWSIKAPVKCQTSVYILTEICFLWSKWFCPKYAIILPTDKGRAKELSSLFYVLYDCRWFDMSFLKAF